ncbi:FAD-dependent oxidoreductase [Candidatus Saccharibacteria bacterium]|nr:FAD-dependent oxidoreductase [Candidatus Saccharibacteria bacterium]
MRVVIVGGGFAGVRAALNLANKPDFDVVLVSKQAYFEYHSALYRSATGRSPLEVAISLTDFFAKDSNIKVIEDEIIHLDHQNKLVAGFSQSAYHYDVLILAVGVVTQYFGIKGLPEFSHSVSTIKEALELKRRLHEDLVAGGRVERNYVVIGGGATGVELSGELISYLNHVRRRHGIKAKFNVDLIEASSNLLPSLPTVFTDNIKQRLKHLGIKLYFNTAVKSETIDEIELPRGEIKSHTVVWTAGITNNPIFAKYPNLFQFGKGGKVIVDQYLETQPGIYVLGDGASTLYSGMAQTAIHDANFVTGNLKRMLANTQRLSYKPKKPIYAIPTGPRWAAVLWGKFEVYGYAGWILRRLADLRLYLTFLPLTKALAAWRAGFTIDETCPICKK